MKKPRRIRTRERREVERSWGENFLQIRWSKSSPEPPSSKVLSSPSSTFPLAKAPPKPAGDEEYNPPIVLQVLEPLFMQFSLPNGTASGHSKTPDVEPISSSSRPGLVPLPSRTLIARNSPVTSQLEEIAATPHQLRSLHVASPGYNLPRHYVQGLPLTVGYPYNRSPDAADPHHRGKNRGKDPDRSKSPILAADFRGDFRPTGLTSGNAPTFEGNPLLSATNPVLAPSPKASTFAGV